MALGEIGSPKAVPTLISKLQDKEYSNRQAVALALGRIADAEAVPALQEVEQQSKGDLRSSVEDALLRIRSRQESAKELLRDLESKNPQVVYYAMRRLDEVKSQEAIPALKGFVRDARSCSDMLGPGIKITCSIGYVAQKTLLQIQAS
jgi:HEAT repeat protein